MIYVGFDKQNLDHIYSVYIALEFCTVTFTYKWLGLRGEIIFFYNHVKASSKDQRNCTNHIPVVYCLFWNHLGSEKGKFKFITRIILSHFCKIKSLDPVTFLSFFIIKFTGRPI